MYAALWRRLPGGVFWKVVQMLLLALVVVAICFLWLFPLIADHLPYQDVVITPTDAPSAGR